MTMESIYMEKIVTVMVILCANSNVSFDQFRSTDIITLVKFAPTIESLVPYACVQHSQNGHTKQFNITYL